MKKALLLLSFGALPFSILAQQAGDPEFETDRPDRTEASSVVPRGFYQLETGFQYQRKKQNTEKQKEWLYPQALLRIGLSKRLELRLEGTYRREEMEEGTAPLQQDKGLSTIRVGTKVNIWEESGLRPKASVLGMVELPWGNDAFEPTDFAPEVRFLFSNTLTEKLSIDYNLGYRRERGDTNMENKLQYAVSMSGKLSDKFTVFAEFFGDKMKNQPVENQIDGGFQFMILPNLQLDAIVGTKVSSSAPDMFVGTGLSLRLPR